METQPTAGPAAGRRKALTTLVLLAAIGLGIYLMFALAGSGKKPASPQGSDAPHNHGDGKPHSH